MFPFSLCTSGHTGVWRLAPGVGAMLLLGLGGSLTHCGPMCGPLVLGQAAARMASLTCTRMCESQRLRTAVMPRYHAGRIAIYALLGAFAGYAGQAIMLWARPLQMVLLLAAAFVLLGMAWLQLHPPTVGLTRWLNLQRVLVGVRPGGLLFGLTLGFLPCHLVYGALLAVSTFGNGPGGALGMMAFGLGTLPVLAAIGVAGRMRGLRSVLMRGRLVMLTFNALILFEAALQVAGQH